MVKHIFSILIGILFVSLVSSRTDFLPFQFGDDELRVFSDRLQFIRSGKDGIEKITSETKVLGIDTLQTIEYAVSSTELTLRWQHSDAQEFIYKITKEETGCESHNYNFPADLEFMQCFPYGNDSWYGGPERSTQEWPLQSLVIQNEPYVTRQANGQGVLEPYWFSSSGSLIYVEPTAPLFIDSNNRGENSLCLIGALRSPYKQRAEPYVVIHTCQFDNAVDAHLNGIKNFLGKPTAHPSPYLMSEPIYSTWVRYKRDVNQEIVKDFTDEIAARGFLPGQIEIDDKWEPCYGALTFDTNSFPNITELVSYIHSKGATASLWIHPFVNVGCSVYNQYRDEGRLVKNQNGNVASVWWNGIGAVVDISNKTTKDWWVGRLKDLVATTGLDGLKLDAGETSWLPQLPEITGDPDLYPDSFVRDFVLAGSEFGSNLEVRVGRSTQDIPVYIRMLDKDTRWGLDNGLHSVITTAFQMGLVGYPFILPDMIGGNVYGDILGKELFIRWLQMNTFLPAVQFSMLPWDFDNETATIALKYLQLHRDYTPLLLEAANRTLEDGRPLVAPLWWFAPNDEATFPINDEYMVGDSLLVAPVIIEGAEERDIYLPAGTWISPRQETLEGPAWIRNYPAPLDFLPYFTKIVNVSVSNNS